MLDFIKTVPPEFYWLFIFFSAFIENIFPPYPGDTVIVFAGYLLGMDMLRFVPLIVSVISGNLISSVLMYFFGENIISFFRNNFKAKSIQKLSSKKNLEKANKWFKKYGMVAVIFSRFSAGTRFFVTILAGISRMRLVLFLIAFTIAIIIWNGILISAGYVLGKNWGELLYYLKIYSWVTSIIFLLGIVVFLWVQKKRREIN